MCRPFRWSKIEFANIHKAFAIIFKHLVGWALPSGGEGAPYESKFGLVRLASWKVAILTLPHFECCTSGFSELCNCRKMKMNLESMKAWDKVCIIRICHHENISWKIQQSQVHTKMFMKFKFFMLKWKSIPVFKLQLYPTIASSRWF